MGAVAFQIDFAQVVARPPSVDWAAAASFIDDLNGLQRLVDAFSDETARWRVSARANILNAFTEIQEKTAGLPDDLVREALFPHLDELQDALESLQQTYAIPLHDRPEWPSIAKLGSLLKIHPLRLLRSATMTSSTRPTSGSRDLGLLKFRACVLRNAASGYTGCTWTLK